MIGDKVQTDNLIWRLQVDGRKIYLWTATMTPEDKANVLKTPSQKVPVTYHQYTGKYDPGTGTVTYDPNQKPTTGKTSLCKNSMFISALNRYVILDVSK